MNYLKFRAAKLREEIDVDRPCSRLLDEAEQCLTEAAAVRAHIVQSNARLVVAIVKKFVSPQHSFDELLSDGMLTLLNAAEKFDYDRGFRFSTYAYRCIARNAYRAVMERRREQQRFASTTDEQIADIAARDSSTAFAERTWETLRRLLAMFVDRLDRREQMIVSARYALGEQQKIATFQSIADSLGVSKERVRQLEQRAVSKLRAMAGQVNIEELMSSPTNRP
jgi:RNA polymerase primary sigma factor